MERAGSWAGRIPAPKTCLIAAVAAGMCSFLYIPFPQLHGPFLAVTLFGSAIVGILVIVLSSAHVALAKGSGFHKDLVNVLLGLVAPGHLVWLLFMLSGFC